MAVTPCRACGRIHCTKHSQEPTRGTTAERGYGGRWQRMAKKYLTSVHHLCEDCHDRGELSPANEVHHKVKHGGDEKLLYDWNNLRALCKPCHSKRTRKGE